MGLKGVNPAVVLMCSRSRNRTIVGLKGLSLVGSPRPLSGRNRTIVGLKDLIHAAIARASVTSQSHHSGIERQIIAYHIDGSETVAIAP